MYAINHCIFIYGSSTLFFEVLTFIYVYINNVGGWAVINMNYYA